MSKARFHWLPGDGSDDHQLRIEIVDPGLLGKPAELLVELKAQVKDSRPVHGRRELYRHAFQLQQALTELRIPRSAVGQCYSHDGSKLDLQLVTRLKVDDGIIFDTSVEGVHALPLGDRPRLAEGDPKMMDPKDTFSLVANLGALPYRNRMIVLALLLVGGLVVLGNLALGVHDEFVPEVSTFFYDHRGSDGSESPIMKALAGSGVLGAGIWASIMYQLRKYMRLVLKPHPPLRRGMRLRIGELIEGESRVALRNVHLKVVACNRECGQYKRGSGSKERTVSFKTPVRAVCLYQRFLPLVPAGAAISLYCNDEVDFTPMFADLLPPLMVSSTHGIDVCWEVQLLHPEYVDHELEGSSAGLVYDDFLDD